MRQVEGFRGKVNDLVQSSLRSNQGGDVLKEGAPFCELSMLVYN